MTLLEVLIGGVVLSVALLGHVATTYSEYQLSRDEQVRSEAHHIIREFMERLRADDDWAGLYARLRPLDVVAGGKPSAGMHLYDGRRAWSPTLYYADFDLPTDLADFAVLVDVPMDPATGQTLREDLDLHAFGMPADLNGDGIVDGEPRNDDYEALPVVVHFCWRPPGKATQELRLSTWLRGHR